MLVNDVEQSILFSSSLLPLKPEVLLVWCLLVPATLYHAANVIGEQAQELKKDSHILDTDPSGCLTLG